MAMVWAVLGPSWGRVGPSWGCPGAVLARLGAVLGRLWAVLGRLGASWGRPGLSVGRFNVMVQRRDQRSHRAGGPGSRAVRRAGRPPRKNTWLRSEKCSPNCHYWGTYHTLPWGAPASHTPSGEGLRPEGTPGRAGRGQLIPAGPRCGLAGGLKSIVPRPLARPYGPKAPPGVWGGREPPKVG